MHFHKGNDNSQSFAKPFYDYVFKAPQAQQTQTTKKDMMKESNRLGKSGYKVNQVHGRLTLWKMGLLGFSNIIKQALRDASKL